MVKDSSRVSLLSLHADELLAQLNHSDPTIRRTAIRNPATPSKSLTQRAVVETNPNVLFYLAMYVKDQETLETLANHQNETVRQGAANNNHINHYVGNILATDVCDEIVFTLDQNQNTPSTVLEMLLLHSSEDVVTQVGEHQNLTVTKMTQLATHPSAEVRTAIAERSDTPIKVIKMLKNDDDSFILHMVEETRVEQINLYCDSIEDPTLRRHAELLAVSFTGWPQEFQQMLTDLHATARPASLPFHSF